MKSVILAVRNGIGILACVLGLLVVSSAHPQKGPAPPPAVPRVQEEVPPSPPWFGEITAVDRKAEVVDYSVIVPVAVVRPEPPQIIPIPRDDDRPRFPLEDPRFERKRLDLPVRVPVRYEKHTYQGRRLTEIEVYDVIGKRLEGEALKKRLVAGTAVLVSSDGRPVDPVFLRVAAKDTVVLVDKEMVKRERLDQPRSVLE